MFDIEKYIAYFEKNDVNFLIYEVEENGKIKELQYPKYDDGLCNFIEEIYDSRLMLKNYMEIVNNEVSGSPLDKKTIEGLDYRRACAVLTWIVRSDRFDETALGRAANDRLLYHVLNKIYEKSKV